jgi:hypothetical protein
MTAFAVSALYPGPEGPGFTARVDKEQCDISEAKEVKNG